MTYVNIIDAQQQLPDLITAVGRGEEFVITSQGKPLARMTAVDTPSLTPRFGSAQGLFKVGADFDEPLDDFAEYV